MKKTEYLYDLNIDYLSKMLYYDALQYKLNCANRLYKKLHTSTEDPERLFYVWKAIEHTRGLLNERDEQD